MPPCLLSAILSFPVWQHLTNRCVYPESKVIILSQESKHVHNVTKFTYKAVFLNAIKIKCLPTLT